MNGRGSVCTHRLSKNLVYNEELGLKPSPPLPWFLLCENAMHMLLATVMTKAKPKTMKFLLPLTSLNKQTPHIDAMNPGPLVINGKAKANPNAEFATNQHDCAVAHKIPEANAGKMASG